MHPAEVLEHSTTAPGLFHVGTLASCLKSSRLLDAELGSYSQSLVKLEPILITARTTSHLVSNIRVHGHIGHMIIPVTCHPQPTPKRGRKRTQNKSTKRTHQGSTVPPGGSPRWFQPSKPLVRGSSSKSGDAKSVIEIVLLNPLYLQVWHSFSKVFLGKSNHLKTSWKKNVLQVP